MAEFETECADHPAHRPTPSKPKYNGGVERANRTCSMTKNPRIGATL